MRSDTDMMWNVSSPCVSRGSSKWKNNGGKFVWTINDDNTCRRERRTLKLHACYLKGRVWRRILSIHKKSGINWGNKTSRQYNNMFIITKGLHFFHTTPTCTHQALSLKLKHFLLEKVQIIWKIISEERRDQLTIPWYQISFIIDKLGADRELLIKMSVTLQSVENWS